MSEKPSFDEIVELISTGQADRIPGIKDIPLKINEQEPSVASMQRPLKPWETQNETQESASGPDVSQQIDERGGGQQQEQ